MAARPPCKCRPGAECRPCYLIRTDPRYAALWPDPPAPPPPPRGRCLWLGRRTEFRRGCGGRNCRHACGHPDPAKRAAHPVAVPGGICQTCDDHVEDG